MHLENWPQNCWYVAARADEVPMVGMLDRTILGARVLLYRDAEGAPVIMQDRCPHRSAPLSKGAREGDGVRCGYHGMLFGADGRCTAIPGQGVIPGNAAVRTYPAHDKYDWTWIWPGDASLADPALIPHLDRADDPVWAWESDYIRYEAAAELLHDNLLDFSHVAFVHAQSFGGGADWAGQGPEVQRLDRGFRFQRWLPDSPIPPFMKDDLPPDLKVDLYNDYSFFAPGVLVNLVVLQPAGSGTRDAMDMSMGPGLFSIQAITPETAQSAHYFFSMGVSKDAPEFVMASYIRGTLQAFEEDRVMIEAQQQLLLAEPDEPIARVAIAADSQLVQMRGMLRKMAQAEKAVTPAEQVSLAHG